MSAPRFYALSTLLIGGGILIIVVAPSESLIVLSLSIPFAIVGAGISTAYLARVFRRQPSPRSRFFRMLVESFFALFLIGVWVGYLSLARVLERAAIADPNVVTIPAPPPTVSSPISALVVLVVFIVPIRFALEVYHRRRLSGETVQSTTEDDDALDRENPSD